MEAQSSKVTKCEKQFWKKAKFIGKCETINILMQKRVALKTS